MHRSILSYKKFSILYSSFIRGKKIARRGDYTDSFSQGLVHQVHDQTNLVHKINGSFSKVCILVRKSPQINGSNRKLK